ncbi:polysaccharide deacetylase family protein [Paenibacillus dendritiformis]|uniref:polysaccharide deacetylase family protein n=2 Tax=Paenibacillus dendritiformis TaxID=130049 RepID=UPI00143CEA6C|nr:polysaccharide deacetylase family protein [Paenibacillus dendritiformis]NKI22495.1 polysaccharide deacetylase family protein [Paenibacillus dendritiformis]NRF97676.1 polysaccharide deacetylase family protein [Paenibacillus dendritiformis]
MRTKQICCLLVCLVVVAGCFPRSHQAAPDPKLNSLETDQPPSEMARQPSQEAAQRAETGQRTISFVLQDKPHPLPHQPLPLPKFHLTMKGAAKTEGAKEKVESDSLVRKSAVRNSAMKQKEPPIPEPAQSASQNTKSGISQHHLSLAQLRMKYPHIFKLHGSKRGLRRVALTFDDVPDNRITPLVLDILREHNIRATFFLVGSRAKAHPDLVRRIVREGHIIGNHSYSHPLMTKLSLPAFEQQVKDAERVIEEIIGYKPRFYRPPFGEINEEQLKWAGDHGYLVVNWDVDSNDWRGLNAREVYNNVINAVRPGSIVLQHAGGSKQNGYLQGTVKALPSIIKELKKQRYRFVTVPELLQDRKDKKDN